METKIKYCLNCRSEIEEKANYCSVCGQKNIPAKLPLIEFFHHFLEDYFTFDSKFFKSTVWILTKPGFLTDQYISGKRASFIPPVRVFLFVSVLFFVYEGVSLSTDENELDTDNFLSTGVNKRDSTGKSLAQGDEIVFGDKATSIMGDCEAEFQQNPDSVQRALRKLTPHEFVNKCHSNASNFEKLIMRKVFKMEQKGITDFKSFLLNAASKTVFLAVPFFALLLKLFYIRKKRYYFEHFVFSLHFHTFLFILFGCLQFCSDYLISIPLWIVIPGVILYLYTSLKTVYKQTALKTILKTTLTTLSYCLLFLPFGAMLTIMYAFVMY